MTGGFDYSGRLPTHLPTRRQARGGCLPRLVLIFLFGCILVLAITAVFAPWAFFMGGRFHILPYWQGWGRLQGPGGEYVLLVQIWPTSRGSRIIPHSNLHGIAYLCTPRQQRFTLKLYGSMRFGLGRSTNGEEIFLGMSNWTWQRSFVTRHPPAVSLHGHWQNPNLVADDEGSFRRAFNPDGTVLYGSFSGPYKQPVSTITLVEGSKSDFEQACAGKHR